MTTQQATIRTLVLSGKYHRYKNWQVKNRCKGVVKGRHWCDSNYYHPITHCDNKHLFTKYKGNSKYPF